MSEYVDLLEDAGVDRVVFLTDFGVLGQPAKVTGHGTYSSVPVTVTGYCWAVLYARGVAVFQFRKLLLPAGSFYGVRL